MLIETSADLEQVSGLYNIHTLLRLCKANRLKMELMLVNSLVNFADIEYVKF